MNEHNASKEGTDKGAALSVEAQGIDTIAKSERKGKSSSLFWPWFSPTSQYWPCPMVPRHWDSASPSGRPH